MPSPLALSVDKERLTIAPGTHGELIVDVQNLSALLDQVTVRVEGIDADWVQIVPASLPVFAQGHAAARAIITPPADSNRSRAGLYPLHIVGSSEQNRENQADCKGELEVELVGDYAVQLEKPVASSQRDGGYPVRIENHANAPLQVHLTPYDEESALWYKFDPYELMVPPGGRADAQLSTRVKTIAEESKTVVFELIGEGVFLPGGMPPIAATPHEVTAQFVEEPPPKIEPPVIALHVEEGASVPPQPSLLRKIGPPEYFSLMVGNPGPTPVIAHVRAEDPTGKLTFQFDREQVALAPGENEALSLLVQLAALPSSRAAIGLPFTVTAFSDQAGCKPVSADCLFVRDAEPFPWMIVIAAALVLCVMGTLMAAVLATIGGVHLFQ